MARLASAQVPPPPQAGAGSAPRSPHLHICAPPPSWVSHAQPSPSLHPLPLPSASPSPSKDPCLVNPGQHPPPHLHPPGPLPPQPRLLQAPVTWYSLSTLAGLDCSHSLWPAPSSPTLPARPVATGCPAPAWGSLQSTSRTLGGSSRPIQGREALPAAPSTILGAKAVCSAFLQVQNTHL